jgi:phosphoribosylformylglycinamidine synthase subunit PurS
MERGNGFVPSSLSVDDSALAEIAESLLANTVIEDWTVSREPQ